MRKNIGLILFMAILLVMITYVEYSMGEEAGAASVYSSGNGTTSDPYLISTPEQLNAIRDNLTAHYRLVNDIDLSSYDNWDPIGTHAYGGDRFTGTLDGDGYKIGNLTIDRPTEDGVGLFSYLYKGAKLSNLGLENVDITGREDVGAVAGVNYDSVVKNVHVTGGTVTGEFRFGGLIGENGGEITNSFIAGLAIYGGRYGGAFVGSNSGDGVIKNSYAASSIKGSDHLGGFAGTSRGGLINVYATGTVEGTGSLGGLISLYSTSPFTNARWETNCSGCSFANTTGSEGSVLPVYPYLKGLSSMEELEVSLEHSNPIYPTDGVQIKVKARHEGGMTFDITGYNEIQYLEMGDQELFEVTAQGKLVAKEPGTAKLTVSLSGIEKELTINVSEAIPPEKPLDVSTIAEEQTGGATVALYWTAPEDWGTGGNKTYEVEFFNGEEWTTVVSNHSSTSYTYTLPKGVNTKEARFRVKGETEHGSSAFTLSDTFTIISTPPTLTLNGDNPLVLEVGSSYQEPGAEAVDKFNNDLTDHITANSSDVNVSKLGTYEVIYTVADSASNTTIKKRTVKVVDQKKPNLTILGENPYILEIGGEYKDPGANAIDNYDGHITSNIQVTGEVNTKKVGNYTLTYSITDSSGNTEFKKRTVEVVDTTPPQITLKGDNPITVNYGEKYEELGYTVMDNSGETLTEDVLITGKVDSDTIGVYQLSYSVKDSTGNKATVKRTVHVVDENQPIIKLNGKNPMTLEVGSDYVEPGATAFDGYDKDLSNQIKRAGTVDTQKLGTYEVRYNVEDSSGNQAFEVSRKVRIVDTTSPKLTLNGKGTVRIEVGQSYNEMGAEAVDNYDGTLTDNIIVEGNVDSRNTGTYTVSYSIEDKSKNRTTLTRTVHVVKVTKIEIVSVPPSVKSGQELPLKVIATYNDGMKKDVSTEVDYILSDTDALHFGNGIITGKRTGMKPITLTVRHKGQEQVVSLRIVNQSAGLGETVPVKGSDLFWVEDSETFIQMPSDLPENTRISVSRSRFKAPGLLPIGDAFTIDMKFPSGSTGYTGDYRLIMGLKKGFKDTKTGIYYFNEQIKQWEYVDGWGNQKDGRIQANVSHFSTYGVFTDNEIPVDLVMKEKRKSAQSITLSLSAYDSSGIKKFIILRDGKKVATVNGNQTEWLDTGLLAGRTYHYTIVAVDMLGNLSAEATASVTTNALVKTTATVAREQIIMEKPNEQIDQVDGLVASIDKDQADKSTTETDKDTTMDSGKDMVTTQNDDQRPREATQKYTLLVIGIILVASASIFVIYRVRKRRLKTIEDYDKIKEQGAEK
ncbi:DUF5011 domain-containing protein [Radiobacillus kanasensis]|uniref:immunoglobulin-like domain-containing protein n=1 Tax=Radiobacillus kanasensis TaxID=2844358 RepID=UPI001E34E38A|nr:immunoglobulin-like domain-containing protein [Radiobacillus kanasensis]UFT99886.1 DUF5011 domain-containing protein [Radiobacillus kanasensis]